MRTDAIQFLEPGHLAVAATEISEPTESDVVVAVEWSGISSGTERLLWRGEMPSFPGLGYPLIPGYEAVGRVVAAGPEAGDRIGTRVFVPGARCFKDVRALFGGAAATLVVPAARAVEIGESHGAEGVLLALAATAFHATASGAQPDLIVGHGILGRLMARLALAAGAAPPTVWEREPLRRGGADGYRVLDPATDERRDYRTIVDASGDAGLLDTLVGRLAPGGEIVLAGFYKAPLSFAFPPAFMREARFRVAAEWKETDLLAVRDLVASGRLSLDGLVTHREPVGRAADAYATAFDDPDCLKMVLDWGAMQ